MTHADRTYIITGGTSGIGSYVAAHLASLGAAVWITGTSRESIARALSDGSAWGAGLGNGAVPVGGSACDMAEPAQIERAFAEAVETLGGIDGVFANAGIDGEGLRAEALDPTVTARVLAVNTIGVLVTLQEAFRHLRRPGVAVVNASVNAIRPERHFADYNASKAAAMSIAQTCALEWGTEDLSVTCLCPGYIPSRMTEQYLDDPQLRPQLLADIPSGRFGTPEEVAKLAAFLLSGEVPYLNGSVIPIAGGRNL